MNFLNKTISLVLTAAILGLFSTSNCKTWLSKESLYQDLTIEGAPEGAKVEVIGSGRLLASGPANKAIKVRKARGLVVRVSKPGYTSAIVVPDPKTEPFPIWSIIVWPYMISFLADVGSGARVHLEPDPIKVELKPLEDGP